MPSAFRRWNSRPFLRHAMRKPFLLVVVGLGPVACGKPSSPTDPKAPSGAVAPGPGAPAELGIAPAVPGAHSPVIARATPADMWNRAIPHADPNVIPLSTSAAPPTALSPRQQAVADAARRITDAFETQQKDLLAAHAGQLAAWRKRQAELKAEQRRLTAALSSVTAPPLPEADPEAEVERPPQVDPAPLAAALEKVERELTIPEPSVTDGDPAANLRLDQLIFHFRQASAKNDAAQMTGILSEIQLLAPRISRSLLAQFQAEISQYLQRAEVGPVVPPRDLPPSPDPRQSQR